MGVFYFSVLPSSVAKTASRASRSGRLALPSRSWTICMQETPATRVIAQSVVCRPGRPTETPGSNMLRPPSLIPCDLSASRKKAPHLLCGHGRIIAGSNCINHRHRARAMTERYLVHFRTGRSICCTAAAQPSRAAAHRCGRREARFRCDGSSFEVMTRDEHEARLALVRRRARQSLRLPVETIQSHQAERTCEVSVALTLNGAAVQVQRIDPALPETSSGLSA